MASGATVQVRAQAVAWASGATVQAGILATLAFKAKVQAVALAFKVMVQAVALAAMACEAWVVVAASSA